MFKSVRSPRFAATLALLVALAAASACELAFTDLRAQSQDEWSRTYELSAAGIVEVHNVNGAIDVEPSSDGKVHVRAERTAKAVSEAAAKELLQKVEIVEQATPDHLRLETRGPRGVLGGGHYSVRYWISLPAGASVKVTNTNGRITLADLSGAVEARTTNGGVAGRGLEGRIEASTTNGGIEMEIDAVDDDGIVLETTNGGVRVSLPASAKADISASVTNGGIDTGALPIERVGETSRRRLEGRLNGGGPRIRLETTNGGIQISEKRS
jgi:DUF4097 and DUF4098 domain-containing protein YvlB